MIFTPSSRLNIKFNNRSIPTENTVTKAVALLSKKYKINIKYKIIIDKKVPIGSGLGGGSSNAAYTLMTLNKLYNLKLNKKELCVLANQIGSDVPFFIKGGIKKILGTGNIIEHINMEILKNKIFLLVIPKFSISTRWAYSKIKKQLHTKEIKPKFPPLTDGVDWTLFENDFEHVVCSAYPEILDIKCLIYKTGALYSGLSGSGSTVFGIYNDIELAQSAADAFDKYLTYIVSPYF
jgi:4-diphosphocytidyl-2-C-methyl-D-erythritol kinase